MKNRVYICKMKRHVVYTVIIILISCQRQECLTSNYSSMREILRRLANINTVSTRLARAIDHIGKTYSLDDRPVFVCIPMKNGVTDVVENIVKYCYLSSAIIVAKVNLHNNPKNDFKPTSAKPEKIKTLQRPNIYVLVTIEHNGFIEFQDTMRELFLGETFNPRAIFIIVMPIKQCGYFNKLQILHKYFEWLWRKNCLITIFFVFSECDFKISVITGKPFSKANPCRSVSPKGLLSYNFNNDDKDIVFNVPVNKSVNLNGCVFTAGTFIAPPFIVGKEVRSGNKTLRKFVGGLEMEIVRLMSIKLNFSVKFDTSHGYGTNAILKRFENGTESGIATDIKNHKIDFALGGVSPNYRTFYMFDFSHSYKFSSFSWYVADASMAPLWQVIIKALRPEVWIMSAMCYILVVVVFFFLQLYKNKKLIKEKFRLSAITLIELLNIGVGLPSSLTVKEWYLKVLIFSWAVLGLHWNMAYSSILFNLLSNPPYENSILTIQDLKNSGFKVVSHALYFQLFKGVNIDNATRAVLDNKINCPDLNVCIIEFVRHRNVSIMDRSEHVEYSVNFKISKIHKLKQNVISFGVSLMTNRGNPISLAMNKTVLMMFETGLIGKWERDAAFFFNFEKNMMGSISVNTDLPLTVTVLQGAFLLLIVGLAVSFITFLLEIIMHRLKE